MKTLYDVNLKDILPYSISKDENVIACCEAIDSQLQLNSSKLDSLYIYKNIDTLSSNILDHLATQYDAPSWNYGWNVSLKRSVIKTIIENNRKKGTVAAVKEALLSLGSAAQIKEWWQEDPKGTPHTFKIHVTLPEYNGIVSTDMQNDLIKMIDDVKPLRSHYDLIMSDTFSNKIGIHGEFRTAILNRF